MKFGKRMRSLITKEWENEYVDYKQIKKLLKVLEQNLKDGADHDAIVSEFSTLLHAEIDKVNLAHSRIVDELQVLELPSLENGIGKKWVLPPSKARSLLIDAIEISYKVDGLRRFVVLNSLAIVKITKKFDKYTGSSIKPTVLEQLKSEAFYDGEVLESITNEAASLTDRIMIRALPDGDFRINQEKASCPICMCAIKSPVTLSCSHTFCWSCLSTAVEHHFHSCPLCRKEQSIDPRDYEIDGLMKRFKRVYEFVEVSLDRPPLVSSPIRAILFECFDLVNNYLNDLEERYSTISPTPSREQQDQEEKIDLSKDEVKGQVKLEIEQGDPVEIAGNAEGTIWHPGMILKVNEDGTFSVIWWMLDNSQRFSKKVQASQLRQPLQLWDTRTSFLGVAAEAIKSATEWAMSPIRRQLQRSFSHVTSSGDVA
jgi:hypothetical protein